MVDFRRLISPKSQNELIKANEELIAIQELDPSALADRLLELSRCLQDSGCFKPDQRYSYDEWAIYRVVPTLARRLDPDVVLRETEKPQDVERNDPITDLSDPTDEKLLRCISSILSHGSFMRAKMPGTDPVVKAATETLFGHGVSLMSIATDTAFPGTYPDRVSLDTREPLKGLYVIEVTDCDYHRVLEYSEDLSLIDRTYDVAISLHTGEEVLERDLDILNRLHRNRLKFSSNSIQIQNSSGEVLREYDLTPETDGPEL